LPSENGSLTNPIRLDGRTVIVFDNGAVLRCTENLPIGQTYILSNPNGRDVVCQVVGGRNLPSVKGYAEVQFMEPVNDFWGIHATTSAPIVAAKVPEARREATQTLSPPVTVPAVPQRETPAKPATTQAGNAPSFDDIGGLLSVPTTNATQERKAPLPQPPSERVASSLSSYSQSGSATFGMVENLTSSNADQTEEKNAKEAVAEALSNALSSGTIASSQSVSSYGHVSSANVFSSKGIMASGQNEPATAPLGGRMPMIVGIIALVLAGAAGGAYMMHRSFDKVPAAAAAAVSQPEASQPTAAPISPASDAASAIEKDKGQSPAENVAMEQSQAATAVSAIPAVVSNAGSNDSKLSRKDTQRSDSAANSKVQSASAAPRRPSIANLKMSSPSTPNRNVVDMGSGAAPLTDMAATEPVSANSSAGLLTASGRTSGQPAPPPGTIVPAPVPAPMQMPTGKIVAPKLISSAHLTYPPSAKQTGIQGTVTVMASVDANGAVSNTKALNGPLLLRQAAADSVKQWKYSPGTIDGKPSASQVTVAVEFKLN
jgi:TonB family protein